MKKINNKLSIKISDLDSISKRKYIVSRGIFVFSSLLTLLIAAATVLLNLFAIRFNAFPQETLALFISISIITFIITFLISIQSFLNIKNIKNIITSNIETNKNAIDLFKDNKTLTKEQVDQLTETL
ncbi:hypothetical protein V2E24_03000 [Mycoplasmopsis ciconiae]|uniref:DUF4231 domain-containing protein n=1 Tax=Mycoplasmopsis ciconiae TaxID=561067 RepID=A0ABU7MM05_9BACT|nr:hypothetical protein [Mycoplasmopsis ciconiae]